MQPSHQVRTKNGNSRHSPSLSTRETGVTGYNSDMSANPEHTAWLTSTPTESEASIVIAALEAEGIRASADEYTSGLRAGPWNWVQVLVGEQDLPQAKEILARVQQENAHLDWSQVDVGEPEEPPAPAEEPAED
jgi:hypothetical protein